MDQGSNIYALKIFATLVALSIPSIIIGRVVIGAELIFALACIFFIPNLRSWRRLAGRSLKSPTAFLIALMLLLWLPSFLVSPDPSKSALTWLRTGMFIIAAVALWATIKENSVIRPYLYRVLIAGTVVLAFIVMIGFIGFSELIGFLRGDGWEKIGVVRNLKESASSATLLIPLLALAGYKMRGYWGIIAIIAILELLGIIWLTGSRSAIAGFIAMFGLVVCMSVFLIRNTLYRILAVAIAFGIIFAALNWLHETRGNYPDHAMAGQFWAPPWLIDPPRQAIWHYAWEAGEDNRWFGVGLNAIDKLPNAKDWNASAGVRNIPLHPHNWVVEVAIEGGLVGFAVMLAVIFKFFIGFLRNFLRSPNPLSLTAMAIWTAYWVSGLFNFSFWSSWWQVSFLIATIICISDREENILSAKNNNC